MSKIDRNLDFWYWEESFPRYHKIFTLQYPKFLESSQMSQTHSYGSGLLKTYQLKLPEQGPTDVNICHFHVQFSSGTPVTFSEDGSTNVLL